MEIKRGILFELTNDDINPDGSFNFPLGMASIIATSAFGGCTGLKSISLPAGVTEIGWYAFAGCADLTSVSLSAGVTSIGHHAFDGCSNLKSVLIETSSQEKFDEIKTKLAMLVPEDIVLSFNESQKIMHLKQVFYDDVIRACAPAQLNEITQSAYPIAPAGFCSALVSHNSSLYFPNYSSVRRPSLSEELKNKLSSRISTVPLPTPGSGRQGLAAYQDRLNDAVSSIIKEYADTTKSDMGFQQQAVEVQQNTSCSM